MQDFYFYCWYFLIYSCLGWCAEVAFAAVKTGKFINRGFLSSPVCPIYGFGVCIALFCLTPIEKHLLLLFPGAVLLTSVLEFLTGYVLEKSYHRHWWDYSKRPLNLKGYICLEFSLLWGVACVLVLKLIHPLFRFLVEHFPMGPGLVLIAAFLSALMIDFISTVLELRRFQKFMNMAQSVRQKLRNLSEDMGEDISAGVLRAVKKSEQAQAEFLAFRAEQTDSYLQNKSEMFLDLYTMMARSSKNHHRIVKAFPNLQDSSKHQRLQEFKTFLRDKLTEK